MTRISCGVSRTLAAQRVEGDLEVRRTTARGDHHRHGGRIHRLDSVAPSHARPPRPQPLPDPGGRGALGRAAARGPAPGGRRARPARAPLRRPLTLAGGARAPARRARRGRRGDAPRASWMPTWCTCTTCCRCPGRAGLEAARSAGASVLLHLHNLRLFCAIGVAARDGGPCFRCHHRNTLPGLALNCRGSLPEAAVYAAALARHQPAVFEAVDRFVVPSSYAAGQAALLGVPADRLDVLPHYLPAEAFAEHSRADRGQLRARGLPALAREGHRRRHRGRGVHRHSAARGGGGTGRGGARGARGAQRGAGGVHRPPRAREPRARARRCGDAPDAVALPRVRPVLGARGDGRRRAGDRVLPGRPAGDARRKALRAAGRRRRAGRAG